MGVPRLNNIPKPALWLVAIIQFVALRLGRARVGTLAAHSCYYGLAQFWRWRWDCPTSEGSDPMPNAALLIESVAVPSEPDKRSAAGLAGTDDPMFRAPAHENVLSCNVADYRLYPRQLRYLPEISGHELAQTTTPPSHDGRPLRQGAASVGGFVPPSVHPLRRRSGIFGPMNELREEPCPARPSFACRLRISQYWRLSWEAANASPNTLLRQKKVPPSGTGPVRGMLGPPYSDQYAPQRGWRCWPRQTVEDALRLKVTRDWSTFCILQAADYAK